MGIPLQNAGRAPYHLERIDKFNKLREARIGFTLNGTYFQENLSEAEIGILETVRETHCRRVIASEVFCLEAMGISVDLDFDIEPFRGPPKEDDDGL